MNRRCFSGSFQFYLFLLLTFCSSLSAQNAPSGFVEGQDYFRVTDKKIEQAIELDALRKVADIEIFYWYGCAPCLQVEQALAEYLAQKPSLNVRRIPLVAYPGWRPQAYLQPLAQELAGRLEVPDYITLYQTCLADCSVLSSYESIKTWLLSRQKNAEFPFIDEGRIWQAEKNYRKRADSYSIRQVPTIIIRESYRVDANSAKSAERMVQIIDFLLTEKP